MRLLVFRKHLCASSGKKEMSTALMKLIFLLSTMFNNSGINDVKRIYL